MQCLTLDVNLLGNQFSQFKNFSFNSMVRFGDTYLLANNHGLYKISGVSDGTQNIASEFKLTTNFGTRQPIYIYSVYIKALADDDLTLTVSVDGRLERSYTASLTNLQKGARIRLGRKMHGLNWSFTISNPSGTAFTIDTIDVRPRLRHAKNI